MARKKDIPMSVKRSVLMEAGYMCANPRCRTILALDLHHMEHVADGGGDTFDNLIALCPNCHRLHHRGEIPSEAIKVWKGMLVALNQAFNKEAIDLLLFLAQDPSTNGIHVERRPEVCSLDSGGVGAHGSTSLETKHARGGGVCRCGLHTPSHRSGPVSRRRLEGRRQICT